MTDLSMQKADWKSEKHVPVIEAPDAVKPGEVFEVTVTLGKEVAHPNTTEHHIAWIDLYFHPEGAKFPHQVGRFEFSAHGESTAGPNQGPVYAHHQVTAALKVTAPGTLHAVSYCNIHGLWENSKDVKLVA
ncbi:MAG: class II SORL domain-containing protein [Anaerolineae bacterium]